MDRYDVLVAGAGPTGLLLAIWLKRLKPDIKLLIIDKKPGPEETSRAIVVHARILEFYRQLGIADEAIGEGKIIETVSTNNSRSKKGSLTFKHIGGGFTEFPFVLAYPQDRHERLLIRHLRKLGVEIGWNQEVQGLQQVNNYSVVRINGRDVWTKFLCGCDGGNSAVRRLADIDVNGGTYPERFYVADAYCEEQRPGWDLGFFTSGRMFTVCLPLDEDASHVRLVGSLGDRTGECVWEDVSELIEQCTRTKIKSVAWFSTYRVHHDVASTFFKDNIFILGDAAHRHSPVGGQGMNTGLSDATNLGFKLAAVLNAEASPEILETYTTERIAFAKRLVATTDRLFSLIAGQGFVPSLIRNLFLPYVLPTLWLIPGFPQIVFQRVSQIEINYRHSELSGGSLGKICAGDRLPWASDGTVNNFEPLKALRWQWHVYGEWPGKLSWHGLEVNRFEFTPAVEAAGLQRDALYLVRPDGYIGLCSEDRYAPEIDEYFARWKLSA